MGNDLARMIEQNAFPSLGEEEGMCFVVANLKKKVKAQHIKAVTSKLPSLTGLTITSSSLKAIPPELANANTKCELKELNLANNAIKQLPKAFNTMFETLATLDLNKNALKIVEDNVGLEKMIFLRRLSLDENKFTEVPAQIFTLTNLVSLHMAKNAIERLPDNLEQLGKLTQLKLDGNRLTEFPTEALAKLSHLEILDLSNNQLSEMNLPKGVKVELKLRAVNLGHNNFKETPRFVFKTTCLTELHLDHNRLTTVPQKFTKLSQLKLLLLNSNKIPEVPLELWAEKFTELQTFDLKDNPLDVNVVEVITKYGSLSLLRPALKAKMEEQAAQRKLMQRTNSISSDEDSQPSSSRRRSSTLGRSHHSPSPSSSHHHTPAAPAPPPASMLAPPPPMQAAGGDVSPRQKFRNNAINRARVVPSVGADDSPEYFARLLEGTDKEVLADEMTALRDKLMYQPHAWLDAFIAAKGLINLLTMLERNAKQLRHVNNDACMLHYDALHCYKILIRVKLRDVLGTTGCVDALAFALLPTVLPSLRKIAAKLLVDLARIKVIGRKKLLLALEKVRRHLVEKKNREELPLVRKRERFRLLINLLGSAQEQDNTEVWEERNRPAPKDSGVDDKVDDKSKAEGGSPTEEAKAESPAPATAAEKAPEEPAPAQEATPEDAKEEDARKSLRLHSMRLINTIISVTSNVTVRVAIRKCLIDLGILDKIMWAENAAGSSHSEWQSEVDIFEAFMEDDNEDLEYMLQRKAKKGKKPARRKTPSYPKRSERSGSLGPGDAPVGSPVDKLRQVRRLNSITNLNRLAAASKTTEEGHDDSDNDHSDSDDDASSTDPTTGDTAFTENDDTYASDEEGEDNWEEEQVPYEDYMRIKVVTLGTSIQMPMVTGAKGHLIVPFDASKTIADISLKVKSQYPEMEATKFDWGLFIVPTETNPDGLWPDEHRHCGFYELKGQVLAEFRLRPWILKITCNATDVINTLTLTKMRFDPHRTCADAVSLVRSRFPHVSAWEEYDWGLYWNKGKGGGSTMTQKSSMASPDSPMSPLKKGRRRTTITKKEKKKLEEEQQQQKIAAEKEKEKEKQEKENPAQEEGAWLVDTERLAAYAGLYMSDDLLELKMKGMGIKVKILSQEAVDFMQFDPMHKVEDILRDMASRVLPDSEKRNFMNYGLYLQRANPDQESSWLQEDKKFNAYKYGPEDCLCYLVRRKPIMVLVYSEKVSAQMTKNEKYATFSRSASRLFNKAQMPIYTHFPVDFMVPVCEVKTQIASKVNAKGEEYELYYRKTPDEVALLDEKLSLHAQQVEAYSRLLFVKNGVFASVEELAGATGDKEEEAKAAQGPGGGGGGDGEEGGEEMPDENFKKLAFEEGSTTEVKAGSLSSLIDHLIETPIYEPEYTKAFLLTHHAFTSSRVVLDYLLKRYLTCSEEIERASLPPPAEEPKGSTTPEKKDKKDKKKKKEGEGAPTPPPPPEEADGKGRAEKTQRRILYLLKVWVDEYFYDFYDEDQLLERLIEFLNQTMVKEGGTSSALVLHQRILQSIESNTMGTGAKGKQVSMEFAPLPRVPRSLDRPNWFIVDEVELARQLTIRSYELFAAIRLFEFFGQPWSKPSTQHLAPNLMAFIEYFNSISRAVSTALLQQRKIRERVKLLTRFIRTAEELRDLGNYHLLQAFIAGFSNSAVARLQWTKARLPKASATSLQELEELMSMNSSFKQYRVRLTSSNPPAIPYIGVCLQDLTFIEDGNRNKTENLINFSKHKLVYGVISLLERFQKTGYNLQRVEEIQNFLKEPVQLDEKQLYSLSLKVEPRNAGRSDIQ